MKWKFKLTCLVLLDERLFEIHSIVALLLQFKIIGLIQKFCTPNSNNISDIQVISFTISEHANSSTTHVERPTHLCFLLRHIINESSNMTPPENDFSPSALRQLASAYALKGSTFLL